MTGQGWAPAALRNIAWRYLWFHRWQSLLMVLGIALGVAVVVSIDLANASAARGFVLSTETVTGKTTHQIIGGPQGVPESVYVTLRRKGLVELAAPIVDAYVTSLQLGDQPLQLLGIDPFADAPFRAFLGQVAIGSTTDLAALDRFLVQPGAVLISQGMAKRYGLSLGDEIELVVGGYPRRVSIVGLLQPKDDLSQRTLDGLVLADISTAQEITATEGWLSRIDLILPPGQDSKSPAAEAQKLQQELPQGLQVVPAAARSGAIQQMTSAFQLNLSALSLLALVVGLFLIYNTMTFSIVQRRGLFGTLRCLGVTRREIFALVLGEATLVGLIGGLAGILLGIGLGQVTIRMVTQTVNDLYFTTTVRNVGIDPLSLLKGGLLGLLASLATAALPAWEAASVPPRLALLRSGLEGKVRGSAGWTALAGLFCGGLGVLAFTIPGGNLLAGFGGTLLVVLGFALLSALTLVWLMRGLAPLMGRGFGLLGRMAPRGLVNALSRTAVAVAALMVAVAVTIGVGLMIDSFRGTVVVWLQQTLQGDVYVSVPGFNATRSSTAIDPQVIQMVQSWPGVLRVDLLRSITASSPSGPLNLSATENPHIGFERIFADRTVAQEQVWAEMQSGAVLISEPLANRLNIRRAGGQIMLDTPQGQQSFHIIGIYYDYASSEGSLLMALSVYRTLWQDQALTALSLRLQPGTNADDVTRGLQDRLGNIQQLYIRPNQVLRSSVLDVFDRTFAITVALRLLATVVAFIGVLNALLLLQMEKQREVGILRALGLTGRQLWKLVMLETGLIGLTAGLLAMPAGYALSLILVYVINRRSFGWTLQMVVSPGAFAQALAVAVVAALAAGIYPAYKMSRTAAAEVIRNE